MTRIKDYLIAFLVGALLVLSAVTFYLLKNVKPDIFTDSYIQDFNQSIKKLKQSGEGNTQDVTQSSSTASIDEDQKPKRKKFLLIFNRRKA